MPQTLFNATTFRAKLRRLTQRGYLLVFGLLVVGVPVMLSLLFHNQVRSLLALAILFVLVSLAFISIRLSLVSTLVYQLFLGDFRRMVLPVAEWSSTDPLLLVGPVFCLLLTAYAWNESLIDFSTPVARCALVLMGIMAIQIFNPRQGPLIVGAMGVLFVMMPLFWFWVGQAFVTKETIRFILFKVVPVVAVIAAALGFYQIIYGYLPYQMDWYYVGGYSALGDPSQGLSPISLFASNTEYVTFLSVAVVILWSRLLRDRAWTQLIPLVFIFLAMVFSGIRGPVAKSLVMAAGLWAILGRSLKTWILRGLIGLVIGAVGLVWSLSQATQLQLDPQMQGALDRQASEFVEQNDGHSSTQVHLFMMINGYADAITDPLGYGLGATTRAASRYGNRVHTTETDLGDSFRSLGFPGGVTYHVFIFLIVLTGFRYWLQTRSGLAMAILGVMGVTFFMWLGGAAYGVNPLLWISIGALDRLHNSQND